MRKLLVAALLLLVLLGVMRQRQHRPLQPEPGVLAAEAPVQVDLGHGAQLQRGDVTLTTRAHFDITARVLSRKDYSSGADGELVPLDLSLGWGRMSDSAVLAQIDIRQSNRFYYWHVESFPIPRREIETSSANMHMIPADDDVKRQLEQIRPGQLMRIEGFLVDASRPGGWHWNTSLTRNDTGAGACELVYVERVDAAAP
ncbi:MAG: hypothetical protein WBG81_06580 [Rhodanobacter sp.]|jgi:hypothetical protein|uniref:hypothetical protein n=1 Tax=Rhodanobacter sp. KK11 TaxID=3083255 RepID=UPI00296737D8|nr:hypothetical protein [Rhodanobacter sp. KK11]MDW2982562.1 hypothetical protein [Rhodanobacter sp. KK11]